MNKDIKTLIKNKNTKYKQLNLWKKVVTILSCLVVFITIQALTLPAVAKNTYTVYKLHLKDTYLEENYSWKIEEGYQTNYALNLYFEDTSGNPITGTDVTIEIGPNALTDIPYGFGIVPIEGEKVRGQDIIEVLNLKEYTLPTGEKYIFDHAEVYINNTWQTFAKTNSNYWHIWCQSSSATSTPTDYGWRGNYNESTRYTITEDTQYKFVYQLIRLGESDAVQSLGADSGIAFNIFNYTGDNSKTGVNANGLYNYFTFRGIGNAEDKFINNTLDADGFISTRAKVLPKLDANGYPVFDCLGLCTEDTTITNTSLGYLFGSTTNATGSPTTGVNAYTPTNTLLQKETIDGVEYYYYDSNRNAVDYDTENNRFMLRGYLERSYTMTTYTNEPDRYEFLPFNYLTNTTPKTNSTNNRTYNYEVEELDHWYGMTMEFTFYMPSNGSIGDKDMVFEFSGDDDVWVFIDDVLVLDLGGTHGAVDGSINFKTGHVESYLNWNGTSSTKNTTTIYEAFQKASSLEEVEWNSTNTTLANYTKHTLKFFYLERGAAVANCKIRFNIPVLPNGSLSVQKQFNSIDKYNDTYEFTLYDVTANAPVANTEYTIGQTKFQTDTNGKFTLKNTEVATFKLTNEHTYYVEETNPGPNAISYACTLDKTPCPSNSKTPEFTINPDSSYQATFTNKVKTFDLNISKIAYTSSQDETFGFKLFLKDENASPVDILDDINIPTNYTVDHDNGIVTFTLKNNQNITIKDIPINTIVTLQEVNHDGYQTIIKENDITLSNNDTYEFIMNTNKNITVHNTPGIILPETGGIGSIYYLFIGTFLILISLKLYNSKFFNMKEGET